jgi:hypothetical protein
MTCSFWMAILISRCSSRSEGRSRILAQQQKLPCLFYHISNTVSPSYHQLIVLFFQQNYFTFVFLLDLTIKQRLSL